MWYKKAYCKNSVCDGLKSIKEACIKILYKNFEKNEENQPKITETPLTADSNFSHFFGEFFKTDQIEETNNFDSKVFKRDKQIDEEISIFAEIIGDTNFIQSLNSTTSFWMDNTIKMPKLYELSMVLLNICSSSAFIERFFSICGLVCGKRSLNMKDDLIIQRSMIKINMSILAELNEIIDKNN